MWKRVGSGVIIAATAVHLILVTFSSAHIPVWDYLGRGMTGQLTALYGYMTGAGNHYGFFAPGVVSQMRVDYTCLRAGKSLARGELGTGNTETTFRWHNLVQNFWLSQDKPDLRRSQAASLAGKVLAKCPEADSVRLSVKAFALPSMEEYERGMRPFWEDHYDAVFRRGASL